MISAFSIDIDMSILKFETSVTSLNVNKNTQCECQFPYIDKKEYFNIINIL